MKSTGSWGMMAILLRRSSRPICAILISSMIMEPPVSSTSLNRAAPREDFPERTQKRYCMKKCVHALKSSFKNKLLPGELKDHFYLILCGPQCQWSLQAGWWRTVSSEQEADCHDNACPHPGRRSCPAEAMMGQEQLLQDSVGVLHSLETEIRNSDGNL